MNDLRKAAEALLNHWEAGEFKNCTGDMAGHIRVLREALAQPDDLQTAIERGTKAWADVPDATEWVDELRGHEPVAWADKVGAVIPHSHKLFQPALLKDYTRPLYTAPQREWVGLTDEEVKYLTSHFDWRAPKEQFVSVIEAKLKEKNT